MVVVRCTFFLFFFNDTATTEIYTLSLHDALPICGCRVLLEPAQPVGAGAGQVRDGYNKVWDFGAGLASNRQPLPANNGTCPRSEEHTSELQSRLHLVCRLLLEKKKTKHSYYTAKN